MQDGSIISPHPAAVKLHDLDELQGDTTANREEKKKKRCLNILSKYLFEPRRTTGVWRWLYTAGTTLTLILYLPGLP